MNSSLILHRPNGRPKGISRVSLYRIVLFKNFEIDAFILIAQFQE